MTIPCAVLMCHAPIVIPAIAGPRAAACARTTAAMKEAARCLLSHRPDLVVIVSPHAPRRPQRFGVSDASVLEGDFATFGAPDVSVRLPGAPSAAVALRKAADQAGLETFALGGRELDHGTLVPLTFLQEAGWNGPTLLVSLPYPEGETEVAIGQAIAHAAAELRARVGLLASGDMSHRLTPGAPAGHHPRARHFDQRFRELVERGDYAGAAAIDPDLRELAAEDVVASFTVAVAALSGQTTGHRVLAYEGPFGVGYLEAVLYEQSAEARRAPARAATDRRVLLEVARDAIEATLHERPYVPPSLSPPLDESRGTFVTLRTRQGELRGCVGHVAPVLPTLAEEVAACAVACATEDTRFLPVGPGELDQLTIEISLLSTPEPIADMSALDPARYGVVVSSGRQRGVLLPDIEGIDTAEDQVRLAARKAGIRSGAPLSVARFEVEKLLEEPRPPRKDDLH